MIQLMPNFKRHHEQAEHNRELLVKFTACEIDRSHSDWYVTIAFYSALHYVEALFYKKKPKISIGKSLQMEIKHSADAQKALKKLSPHSARNEVLRKNSTQFNDIYFNYKYLYDESRTARYECHSPSRADYVEAGKALEEIRNDFESLK